MHGLCFPIEFRKQFRTESVRKSGTSAASNAGIGFELWDQHGAWNSFASQECYMERDKDAILSLPRDAMGHVWKRAGHKRPAAGVAG
jgi:hypothetical protein